MQNHLAFRTASGPDGFLARAALAGAVLAAALIGRTAVAWPAAQLELPSAARQSSSFPAPQALESAVWFWTEMFTRYPSTVSVLHDREHMELIWQVIELPLDEKGEVDAKRSRSTVKKALEGLQRRLRRLANGATPRDAEDERLLALVGERKQLLRGAARRLRSQFGVADKFNQGLERARRFLPLIERVLREEDVPRELAALPFVESMFDPRIRSCAGALGLWQLMPGTARGLGLTVNSEKDDRLDVIKSTRAAIRMLRNNYRMLGNWPLALTGYNHGPYGLKRAIAEVGSTDLVYLIENYERSTWGFASKNFYAEFLAAIRVFAAREARFAALIDLESETTPTGIQ